jgi:hypothetical protein
MHEREQRHEQGGGAARRKVASCAADATDQHGQEASRAAGRDLREKREDEQQHATGRHSDQEAHRDVEAELGHRPADRGADEEHGCEHQPSTPPDAVAEQTPEHAPDGGAQQCGQQEISGRGDGDPVLGGHARHHDAERGRLHDVDDQSDGQNCQQSDVGPREAASVHRPDIHDQRAVDLRAWPDHPVRCEREAGEDQSHPCQHHWRHGHSHHPIAHGPGRQQVGPVEQRSHRDEETADDECAPAPGSVVVCGDRGCIHLAVPGCERMAPEASPTLRKRLREMRRPRRARAVSRPAWPSPQRGVAPRPPIPPARTRSTRRRARPHTRAAGSGDASVCGIGNASLVAASIQSALGLPDQRQLRILAYHRHPHSVQDRGGDVRAWHAARERSR